MSPVSFPPNFVNTIPPLSVCCGKAYGKPEHFPSILFLLLSVLVTVVVAAWEYNKFARICAHHST